MAKSSGSTRATNSKTASASRTYKTALSSSVTTKYWERLRLRTREYIFASSKSLSIDNGQIVSDNPKAIQTLGIHLPRISKLQEEAINAQREAERLGSKKKNRAYDRALTRADNAQENLEYYIKKYIK